MASLRGNDSEVVFFFIKDDTMIYKINVIYKD